MKTRAAAGFSLVEVLIAIAVLGVILVAVGGLMTGNLTLRRESNRATEAVQLATSYLESFKRHWSVLDNYVIVDLPPVPSDPRISRYSFVTDIRCVDLDGSVLASCPANPELRQVHVTVTDARGASESLVTQIGRPFDIGGGP